MKRSSRAIGGLRRWFRHFENISNEPEDVESAELFWLLEFDDSLEIFLSENHMTDWSRFELEAALVLYAVDQSVRALARRDVEDAIFYTLQATERYMVSPVCQAVVGKSAAAAT
jgi:hypothetical protein